MGPVIFAGVQTDGSGSSVDGAGRLGSARIVAEADGAVRRGHRYLKLLGWVAPTAAAQQCSDPAVYLEQCARHFEPHGKACPSNRCVGRTAGVIQGTSIDCDAIQPSGGRAACSQVESNCATAEDARTACLTGQAVAARPTDAQHIGAQRGLTDQARVGHRHYEPGGVRRSVGRASDGACCAILRLADGHIR